MREMLPVTSKAKTTGVNAWPLHSRNLSRIKTRASMSWSSAPGSRGFICYYKLRGLGLAVKVFEQGGDVGGTWYWNRYPGARCDVESMQYSFSFDNKLQQEWDWSERYAPQPEILRYAGHVADRYDLRRDIQFNTTVKSAVFDERANRWTVTTSDGQTTTAQHVVLATGCLSNARTPEFRGMKDFKGKVYHTGNWPHETVDFTGLRVGVIGTGSSAIQSIPLIAEQASQLTVFQRTANFSVPARNAPLTDDERKSFRDNYPEIRRQAREDFKNGIVQPIPDRGALDDPEHERREKYHARWTSGGLTFMGVYNNLVLDQRANDTAADFIRERISEIVSDPETARLLQPNGSSGWFKAYLRRHRLLCDLQSPACDAGRYQGPSDRADSAECRAHRRQGLRGRRAGARHRLRRDDRLGRQDRHSRPRRPDAE